MESYQLDAITMSEDIIKVIAHSWKRRDIALNGVTRLDENIVDFKKQLDLTDGKCVIVDYIENIL